MTEQPAVVLFDVNETLSDLSALAPRLTEVGAPEQLLATWFASVLRDGFALAAAGTQAPFADVASGVLRTVLASVPELHGDADDAVEHVMAGFAQLPVHPDVPGGVRALRRAGLRLVTLTNGSTPVSASVLERAGIAGEFEQLLSVEDAGSWKPAPASYAYAARACGVDAGQLMLVAVHPWDIDGAARAGLRTAWVNRSGGPYPSHLTAPELTVSGVQALAAALGG